MAQNDNVNHPSHYVSHPSGIECIQVTEAFNFCLGNAIKYIWRAGLKGDAKQDLEKARWYVDREIQRLTAEANAAREIAKQAEAAARAEAAAEARARALEQEAEAVMSKSDDEEPNPWDALHNHRAMGPWEHVGYTSDEGFDKLEATQGRFYTAGLRPYLDKLKESAKGGLVGEQGPELMPLKVSYSVPVDDEIPKLEEFDDSGLIGYTRRLAKAASEMEDERIERLVEQALGDYPVEHIRVARTIGNPHATVEIYNPDSREWATY